MDAQLFRILAQAAKHLLTAEHRVDFTVIARVIFVVGIGGENGVEVQNADAQLFEIRQLLAHAFQVAAEEVVGEVIPVSAIFRKGISSQFSCRMIFCPSLAWVSASVP